MAGSVHPATDGGAGRRLEPDDGSRTATGRASVDSASSDASARAVRAPHADRRLLCCSRLAHTRCGFATMLPMSWERRVNRTGGVGSGRPARRSASSVRHPVAREATARQDSAAPAPPWLGGGDRRRALGAAGSLLTLRWRRRGRCWCAGSHAVPAARFLHRHAGSFSDAEGAPVVRHCRCT